MRDAAEVEDEQRMDDVFALGVEDVVIGDLDEAEQEGGERQEDDEQCA